VEHSPHLFLEIASFTLMNGWEQMIRVESHLVDVMRSLIALLTVANSLQPLKVMVRLFEFMIWDLKVRVC
jgi:hypothetical protein